MVEESSVERVLSLRIYNPDVEIPSPFLDTRLNKYVDLFLLAFSKNSNPDYSKPNAQYLKKLSFPEKSGIYRSLFAQGCVYNLEGLLGSGNFFIRAAASFRENFMGIEVIKGGLDSI
ncbi:hypothetical protein HYV80_05410 [Candidatus Woesearchaeota archaeon]|nr:hypothetical protein [Candidatus Woesearchaeota archaeon]